MKHFQTGAVVGFHTLEEEQQILFRFPQWDDVEGLVDLLAEIADEGSFITFLPDEITKEEVLGFYSELLTAMELQDAVILLAVCENSLVGVAVAERNVRDGQAGLHCVELGILIHPAFRNKGIGSKLLSALINQINQLLPGVRVLQLWVSDDNDVAKKLYSNLGFVESGRIAQGIARGGSYIDKLLMVKLG